MLQQSGQQLLVAVDAQQHAIFHGSQQLASGFFTCGAVGDDFAQHRVIERADVLTFQYPMIDPHTVTLRGLPAHDLAGLGHESLRRVLGVKPHFHRVTLGLNLLLTQR